MEKLYQAPQLMLIGEANVLVMGAGSNGVDLPHLSAPDFEFEED